MGLNEQLKADLETGQTKFASAATELQTIKDEIDQVAKNLSPEEQKWVGAASSDCQETLRTFDDASRDAITAMGDTAEAIKEMRQGIIDAEEEAEREAKKEEIANIVILVLSVVYLPLAGEVAGGTLEAESAVKAVKMLIDLDQRIAALFRRIAAAMKKIGKELKTDLPEASKIEPIEVDPIVPSPSVSIEPPIKVPASKPAPTPEVGAPVKTPEDALPVEPPPTPHTTNDGATPLNEPEAPTPMNKGEQPLTKKEGEAPVKEPEVPQPAEKPEPPQAETPMKEAEKPRPDSAFFDGPFEKPGKPGKPPTELPKEIAPQEPVQVYTVTFSDDTTVFEFNPGESANSPPHINTEQIIEEIPLGDAINPGGADQPGFLNLRPNADFDEILLGFRAQNEQILEDFPFLDEANPFANVADVDFDQIDQIAADVFLEADQAAEGAEIIAANIDFRLNQAIEALIQALRDAITRIHPRW